VLTVSGSDALTYLQGQVSQDIRNLGDGETTYTFVLQPIGKVDALARIHRVSADEFRLDTDTGFGEQLVARLNRFKIRVKVDIELSSATLIAVRDAVGDTAASIAGGLPAWGRDDAFDVFGGAPELTDMHHGSPDDLLRARIEVGWPAMGSEITDATIPAETGVTAHAVSFTKGCYPGQELVERMDSRGSTAPRFVRRLRGEGSVTIGNEVLRDGKAVGNLTSVAETDEGWVALAVIARSAQPDDAVTVGGMASTVEDTTR
jgi:tRNA-modifying protein YgfZ